MEEEEDPGTEDAVPEEADVAAEVFDLCTPEEKANYERAMAMITRLVNRRKTFQNLMQTIKQAKEKFMDEEALRAGAEEGKFYTNAALILRSGLRDNPKVLEALGTAWRCVLAASTHAQKRKKLNEKVDKSQYAVMFRKLYLFIKDEQNDTQIDPTDAMDTVDAEWERDAAQNKTTLQLEMTRKAFFNSWFEMAGAL